MELIDILSGRRYDGPQRTAGPREACGCPNCRNRLSNNDIETIVVLKRTGERARVVWSWDNPPGMIKPGEVVRIAVKYTVQEMVGTQWESSGFVAAVFDAPGLPYGKGTDAAVRLVGLSISPKTTRPGATQLLTNTTVPSPNQSGEKAVKVSIGGAWSGPGYMVEYRFRWVP